MLKLHTPLHTDLLAVKLQEHLDPRDSVHHVGVLPIPHGLHTGGHFRAGGALILDQADGLGVQSVNVAELLSGERGVLLRKAMVLTSSIFLWGAAFQAHRPGPRLKRISTLDDCPGFYILVARLFALVVVGVGNMRNFAVCGLVCFVDLVKQFHFGSADNVAADLLSDVVNKFWADGLEDMS